jgi:hypothetical protein
VKALRVVVLGLATVVVVYVGIRLWFAASTLTDTNCRSTNPSLPGWAILLVCVALFGVGRLAAELRDESADEQPAAPPMRRDRIAGALAVKVALCLLFLFGVLALTYETVGVWPPHPTGLNPITYYVRCGTAAAPKTTLLVAGTIAFFAGHWLWFGKREND